MTGLDLVLWWIGLVTMLGIGIPMLILLMIAGLDWALNSALHSFKVYGSVIDFIRKNHPTSWWGSRDD